MAMKKQNDQPLVRLKTLVDSNDDDDLTSTSSASQDGDSDRSSRISDLMRENERKIRNLSESYMNRFLMAGQQLQLLPPPSSTGNSALTRPLSAATRSSNPPRGSRRDSESAIPPNSFNLFIETLKQLIIREEKKRGSSFFLFFLFRLLRFFICLLKRNPTYPLRMVLVFLIHTLGSHWE